MKQLITSYVGIGLMFNLASVFAVTATLRTSQPLNVVSPKHLPSKLRPLICPSWGCGPAPIKPIPISLFLRICPSWGCGTPPWLVPIKLEITCQGSINGESDVDCLD